MDAGSPHESKQAERLAWVFPPWLLPFWYASIAVGWWRVFPADLESQAAAALAAWPLGLAGALAASGKFLGCAVESAFYVLWWKSQGRRLPFWRFFCVVVSASMADLLAGALADTARSHPGALEQWLAPVAGLSIATGSAFHSVPALRAALGTVGLLTAVRIVITGYAQAQALGLRLSAAVGWTVVVWMLTRVAILWMVDLIKGMSPVSGG